MENILCIYGKSQYDSTRLFLDGMMDAAREQGICVDYLDCYDEDEFVTQWRALETRQYDAVVSINGMALEPDSALGKRLLRSPTVYCTMLMDHPMIHHERMKNPYPYLLVLSPDYHHVRYLEEHYPNIWCEGFLAHAGNRAKTLRPYRERTHVVSFMGSYLEPERVWRDMEQYPAQMKTLLQDCARQMLADTELTLEQSLRQVLSKQGFQGEIAGFTDIMAEFRIVDRYVRSYFRDKAVRTLVDAGVPVDIYGDGWQNIKVQNKDMLRLHERVGFEESLEIVADSKISLNVMPWFKEGSHDRVYTAMLCGAVCLTDSSTYLTEQCQDGEHLVYYSLDKMERLPELVNSLLEDDTKAERIAKQGQELAQERHTWWHRGMEVLDYLRTVKQMQS